MLALLLIVLLFVLAVVLGIAVIGLALKLLLWALVGLIIGALARLLLPGHRPIGWLGTIAAGIAGALLGGLLADAFDGNGLLEFVLAVAVAALLIAMVTGRRRAYA